MHFRAGITSLWIKRTSFSSLSLFSLLSFFSKKITDKKPRPTLKKSSDSKNTESNSNNSTNRATTSSSSPSSIEQQQQHQHSISAQLKPLEFCSVCQSPFNTAATADDSESEIDNIVSCNRCSSQTCSSPQCAIWLPKHNRWECSNCHHFDSVVYVQSYDWLFERLSQRFDDKANVARVTNTTQINDTHTKTDDDGVMLELNGNSMVSASNFIFR